MKFVTKTLSFVALVLMVIALSTCGGGGGGDKDEDDKDQDCRDSATNAGYTNYELLNPKPCENGVFGHKVEVLPNGNVVVSIPFLSGISPSKSAIHLFNPLTQELIKSHFSEFRGESFLVSLPNSNFVIVSPDANEERDSGSVMLVNGQTGSQIGNTIAAELIRDNFRFDAITPLANNNFVISSPLSSENGSVMLVDGNTGEQIGDIIAGDNFLDQFSSGGVVGLENGNFVVASPKDLVAGLSHAGSVKLFDGDTGTQIGNSFVGDSANDNLGYLGNVKDLGNGNFVIASSIDMVAGIDDAGSVILVDGSTGLQIGSVLSGDDKRDRFGSGITVLFNGNFVVFSNYDDHNGITDASTVRLIDGATGAVIGNLFTSDSDGDVLSMPSQVRFSPVRIFALPSANFVIDSQFESIGGKAKVGSVRLVSGTTGMQIGSTLEGELEEDRLGSRLKILKNNNFVVVSRVDGNNIFSSGLVRLVDGETGAQIGNAIVGNPFYDRGILDIATLPNGNFVVPTPFAGKDFSGTVILVDGVTGNQIGETIEGDNEFDRLGSGGVYALSNNNFVIVSDKDNVGGKESVGSIRLVDGVTGLQIGQPIVGKSMEDFSSANIVDLENSEFYILSLPIADINDLKDSGFVGLFKKSP